jgi:ribose 5-phosphate isomerase RpiB
MPSLLDNLPQGALSSTTGQGIAVAASTVAGAIAAHFTSDTQVIAAVGLLAGALVLVLFPQRSAAPTVAAAPATDLATSLATLQKVVTDADAVKSALAAIATPKPPVP